jgi:hypothetical protein
MLASKLALKAATSESEKGAVAVELENTKQEEGESPDL